MKVIDVTFSFTCSEEDADSLKRQLQDWYKTNESTLVNSAFTISKPRRMEKWMAEHFLPDMEP